MARVLVSTYGFEESKVLGALRWLPYDRLVLVAGGRSLRERGLRRIEEAERAAGGRVEVVRVDPFDLASCFRGTLEAIERHRRAGDEVRVNVSGGTKVLADGALLAAFQAGVEAWHCEDKAVRLPVLRGVRFEDRLPPAQRAVLGSLRRPVPAARLVDRLRARGHSEAAVQAAILSLREQGLVEVAITRGAAVVSLDPRGEWFARSLVKL